MTVSDAAVRVLGDVVLLNRAIYGGDNELADRYLADFDPDVDPSDAGIRADLNTYDRYDDYLDQLGLRTLSSSDLGFADSDVAAKDDLLPGDGNGIDRNYSYRGDLWRNHVQHVDGTLEAPFPDAAAVALAAVRETDTGKTLHLVFRGTDADLGKDGEAGTGPGQVRYYEQLKPLIDQALAYAADPGNGITEVVVSGHSLGGAMVDLFALYDSAAFRALDGVDLQMVALASAGVDPAVLALRPDFDRSLVEVGPDGLVRLVTPEGYTQVDHAGDIVRNPWRYDAAEHGAKDPDAAQVAFTTAATSTLREHLHFEGARLEIETPTVDQYALSADFETNFLAQHYASFYELNATAVADALEATGRSVGEFDRIVALTGRNAAIEETSAHNNANGWNLPVDDTVDLSGEDGGLLVLGLDGTDSVIGGAGNDLVDGGAGNDSLDAGAGEDTLLGGAGADLLVGGTEAAADDVAADPGATASVASDGDTGLVLLDGVVDVNVVIGVDVDVDVDVDGDTGGPEYPTAETGAADLLYGNTGDDTLSGGSGDDTLFGGQDADLLVAGDGTDALVGGRGDDVLQGGDDADLFVIDNGGGSDLIADFDGGSGDRIAIRANLNASGIRSFQDLRDRAADTDDGVEIDLGDGNTLTLAGLRTDQLVDGYFVFG